MRWAFPDVVDRTVDPEEVDREIVRLRDAVSEVADQLEHLRRRTMQRAGTEEAGIFDAQIMMVQDEDFLPGVEALIRKNNLAAETAYEFKALEIRNAFQRAEVRCCATGSPILNAIQLRMLAQLMGGSADDGWLARDRGEVILVARELSPGLTVQLDRDHVVGVISEEGTRTSHAAILAHSLGIPAVMGATGAMDRIAEGTMVLLDGHSGVVIIDPTLDELEAARVQATRRAKLEMQLEGIAGEPAITPDGHRMGSARATSTSPRRSSRRCTTAPREWACCAPSSW